MLPAPSPDSPIEPSAPARSAWTREQAANFVFCAGVLLGGPLILLYFGRDRWFFGDEWDFIASRQADSLSDMFRHHVGHWVTIPALLFRALWALFGFNYAPYQALIVAAHIGTIMLLHTVMRRASVDPWIATVAALGLLLFGGGEEDIVIAFQITLVGGFALGLVHLLLLDHDGPLDWRDGVGLAAGALALMCSGVGLVMALLAAAAALLRRGPAVAALHALPLFALHAAWWWFERPAAVLPFEQRWATPLELVWWNAVGFFGALSTFGYFRAIGIALAGLLVVGLALARRMWGTAEGRRAAILPGVLLLGAFVFLSIAGVTRANLGAHQAYASRYVYIVMALTLPAIAIAADAVVARWPRAIIPVIALLLAGVPNNAMRFGTGFPFTADYFRQQRRFISALPRMPIAAKVDQGVEPEPLLAAGLTIGWLRDQYLAGRLPEPRPPVDPGYASNLRVRITVAQSRGDLPPACMAFGVPSVIYTRRGDVIWFRGRPMIVQQMQNGKPIPASAVTFNPDIGERLTIQVDGLQLWFSPAKPEATLRLGPALDRPLQLCRARLG